MATALPPPASPGDPDIIYIRGSVSGGSITFTFNGGGAGTGSLSGETASGNWQDGSGESGTFSGSTVGCQ